MKPLTFKTFDFDSAEYEKACHLRDAVLRKPIGLCLYDEDLSGERDQMHFGLFNHASEIVACAIAAPESDTSAKLRQMAVSSAHQGKGYGSALVTFLESQLYQEGFHEIHLHARSTAIPFYKKIGYEEQGAIFIEVGIPHVFMKKHLGK